MKNLLIATTALVATAGMASAEITFSGKGEAGMYQTAKTDAVAAKLGLQTAQNTTVVVSAASGVGVFTNGALSSADNALTGAAAYAAANDASVTIATATGLVTTTAATGTATAATAASVTAALIDLRAAQDAVTAKARLLAIEVADGDDAGADKAANELAALQTIEAVMQAQYNKQLGTAAVAAVASGDMVAYSGYDVNDAMSAETDSGIVFGMGFDMGAGLIADQNDDRAMDTQGETIATSALTATMSGYTLSIGSDKLDDVYDDRQNGDIGLSGNVGGVAFNLVHDLTDEVVAKKATYTAATQVARTAANSSIVLETGGAYVHGTTSATAVSGDSDYVNAAFSGTAAGAVESTSLSLGGAVGAVSYTFAATNGNDSGDSAAKGSLTYTGVENLSLTLAHDNVGKLEGISKVTAKYTMGSLTATLSMADDKDHTGNTNKSKKASNNLSLAYAANGLAATFATDESSQWWVNTQYDLGGGAQAFATIDHTEFAVVGLNFNF